MSRTLMKCLCSLFRLKAFENVISYCLNNDRDLQVKALEVMCFFGRQDCVDMSRQFFESWLEQNST